MSVSNTKNFISLKDVCCASFQWERQLIQLQSVLRMKTSLTPNKGWRMISGVDVNEWNGSHFAHEKVTSSNPFSRLPSRWTFSEFAFFWNSKTWPRTYMCVPSSLTSWCTTSSMLCVGRSSGTACAFAPDNVRRCELVWRSAWNASKSRIKHWTHDSKWSSVKVAAQPSQMVFLVLKFKQ